MLLLFLLSNLEVMETPLPVDYLTKVSTTP